MIVKNFKAVVLSSTVLSFQTSVKVQVVFLSSTVLSFQTSVKVRVVFFIVDLVEFPDVSGIVSGTDPVHVHVGLTFNDLKLYVVVVPGPDPVHVEWRERRGCLGSRRWWWTFRRISAEFQPKVPSACWYSACLLCHIYIILAITFLATLMKSLSGFSTYFLNYQKMGRKLE